MCLCGPAAEFELATLELVVNAPPLQPGKRACNLAYASSNGGPFIGLAMTVGPPCNFPAASICMH